MAINSIQNTSDPIDSDMISQTAKFSGNGLPLPDELIVKILAQTSLSDHANIRSTCKAFSKCTNDTDYWVQMSSQIDDLAQILNSRDSAPVDREKLIKDLFNLKKNLASNSRTIRDFFSGRISEVRVNSVSFLGNDSLKQILSAAFMLISRDSISGYRISEYCHDNLSLLNQYESLDTFIVNNVEKIESLFDEKDLSLGGKVFFANMELRANIDNGKYCSLVLQDLNNARYFYEITQTLALALNYPHLLEYIFLKCNNVQNFSNAINLNFFELSKRWSNVCDLGHLNHIVKNWNSYGRKIVFTRNIKDHAELFRVYKYARSSGNDLAAKEILGRFLTIYLHRIGCAIGLAGTSALGCFIGFWSAQLIKILAHLDIRHDQFPYSESVLKMDSLQISRQDFSKCIILYVIFSALLFLGASIMVALCAVGFFFFRDLYKYYLSPTDGIDNNKKRIWTVLQY